jgi:hypothetical protein
MDTTKHDEKEKTEKLGAEKWITDRVIRACVASVVICKVFLFNHE